MRENLETVVIDILAAEFLIKRNDEDAYSKYIQKVYALDQFDKELLETGFIVRQLHYSSIGALLTHENDYDNAVKYILYFLDHPADRGYW